MPRRKKRKVNKPPVATSPTPPPTPSPSTSDNGKNDDKDPSYSKKRKKKSTSPKSPIKPIDTLAPRKCPLCEKAYRVISDLRNHYRTHTGLRAYICKYPNCNQTEWASGSILIKHIRKRHLDNDMQAPVDEWIQVQQNLIDEESAALGLNKFKSRKTSESRNQRYLEILAARRKIQEEKRQLKEEQLAKFDEEHMIHLKPLPHVCPMAGCNESFHTQADLRVHFAVNTKKHFSKKQPYYCVFPNCIVKQGSEHFLRSVVLKHIATSHFGVPPQEIDNLTEEERMRDEQYLAFRAGTLKPELEKAEFKEKVRRVRWQADQRKMETRGMSSAQFGYDSLDELCPLAKDHISD